MPRKRRTFTIDFKKEVVAQYLGGETLHRVARRHQIDPGLLRIWIEKAEAGEVPGCPSPGRPSPRWGGSSTTGKPAASSVPTDVLRTDGHRFAPLAPASEAIRSLLESFWPGAAVVFADVDSPIAFAFLDRFPTPQSAHHLGHAPRPRRGDPRARRPHRAGGRGPARHASSCPSHGRGASARRRYALSSATSANASRPRTSSPPRRASARCHCRSDQWRSNGNPTPQEDAAASWSDGPATTASAPGFASSGEPAPTGKPTNQSATSPPDRSKPRREVDTGCLAAPAPPALLLQVSGRKWASWRATVGMVSPTSTCNAQARHRR